MNTTYIIASLILLALSFVQNVSFSIVSRSRNRNNMKFHLIAAFFSNSIWFLTFRELVTRDMSIALFPWYCAGTMFGSVFGVRISMWIERRLGAESDGHLNKPKVDVVALEQRLKRLEDAHPKTFFTHAEAHPQPSYLGTDSKPTITGAQPR